MDKKNLTIEETFALAVQNQQKNNLQVAENLYKEILKTNPNHVDAHNNLGVILLQSGNLQKAKSCYEKAIEINPTNAVAHNNLGAAFKQSGEYQKAISSYEKAIKINPNYAVAHENLGKIFRNLKEFQKAADYFKKVDTSLGNAQFLECTYLSDGVGNYNKLLNTFTERNPTNLRIAALAAYVSKKENIKNIYPFCKNPLDYFFSINLKDGFEFSDQFSNRLLKISEKLGSNWRLKPLIKNGHQSTGNLLNNPILEIEELKKKIEKQISIYRKNYQKSDDYYISRWPTKSILLGWYVKLKKQGQLKSHMHESGWLSGVFYLKIPKPLKINEGSINLSLQGPDYPYDKSLPNFYYAPKPFDLILYPSSLFHYTVPFTSNEERHCIAFDVTPK